MLPDGCRLRVNLEEGKASNPEILRYWDTLSGVDECCQALRSMPRGEGVDGFRERLEAAVERRFVADVPLGAFLSSGMDSTAVVGLMTEVVEKSLRTFTVVFEDHG